MMLSTLLQCCIVIVMQIKLTVVVVVVERSQGAKECFGNAGHWWCRRTRCSLIDSGASCNIMGQQT